MVVGWVLVGCFAAALLAATVTTDHVARPSGADDEGAPEAFVEAWERARTATFVRTGTFERRSDVTGSVISSEDVLAQRPPQRLHRQLGGVEGRDDRRTVSCPSRPAGEAGECTVSDATGPSYSEDVAREVEDLRALVGGSAPVYAVTRAPGPSCFDLALLRVEPRAPFGTDARFCFDPETGAPTDSRVAYAGGIVEVVAVTDLRGEVTDADLSP
jgi:hypothetical protein